MNNQEKQQSEQKRWSELLVDKTFRNKFMIIHSQNKILAYEKLNELVLFYTE